METVPIAWSERLKGIRQWLGKLYRRLDAASGGALGVLRRAGERMGKMRVAEAAAAMAYYEMFSLFPLLLALISAGSFFMESNEVYRQVVEFISNAIPVSRDLIETNIQRVLQLRSPVGLIGLLGLAWSGSGFFNALALHVSRAWPASKPRGFLRRRLVAFAMVGTLVVLLLLSVIAGAVLQVVSCEQVAALGIPLNLCQSVAWAISARLAPWLLTYAGLPGALSLDAAGGCVLAGGRVGRIDGLRVVASGDLRLHLVPRRRLGRLRAGVWLAGHGGGVAVLDVSLEHDRAVWRTPERGQRLAASAQARSRSISRGGVMLHEITNYLPLNEHLGTAGQPTEAQIAEIAAAGYEVVINLALHDADYSLVDEAGAVREAGMEYIHIPVEWEHPTPADLERFCDAMDAHRGAQGVRALRDEYARLGLCGALSHLAAGVGA